MLWRIDRSNPDHPEGVITRAHDLHYDANRKSVIFFPGADIDHSSPPHVIGGNIGLIEQTMSCALRADPNIDIYLYTYDDKFEDYGASKNYFAGRKHDNHYSRNACLYGLGRLLRVGDESLSDLSNEELKERLSHITGVGQCYGSIAQQGLVDEFETLLKRHGFSDRDVMEIMPELVLVNAASLARPKTDGPMATQFHFTADNDTMAIDAIHERCPSREKAFQHLEQSGYEKAVAWLRQQPGEARFEDLSKAYAASVHEQAAKAPKPVPRQIGQNQYRVSGLVPDTQVCWVEYTHDGQERLRAIPAPNPNPDLAKVRHDYRNFLYGSPIGISLINVVNNAIGRDAGIGDGHRLLMNTERSVAQHADRAHNRLRANQLVEMQGR